MKLKLALLLRRWQLPCERWGTAGTLPGWGAGGVVSVPMKSRISCYQAAAGPAAGTAAVLPLEDSFLRTVNQV